MKVDPLGVKTPIKEIVFDYDKTRCMGWTIHFNSPLAVIISFRFLSEVCETDPPEIYSMGEGLCCLFNMGERIEIHHEIEDARYHLDVFRGRPYLKIFSRTIKHLPQLPLDMLESKKVAACYMNPPSRTHQSQSSIN